MNKKRILSYLLTIGVVLGGSNLTYAGENTEKPAVVEEEETETKAAYINDEDAVKIADKYMKDYFNIDTKCFSGNHIERFDKSYYGEVGVIRVFYDSTEPEINGFNFNDVAIDDETGEVIQLFRTYEFKKFDGEINRDKLKSSILNVLDKAGLKPDNDIDLDKAYIETKYGTAFMYVYVNGGKVVSLEMSLEDCSLITFYKMYKTYPNEKWDGYKIS